jgi:hypothetical protein
VPRASIFFLVTAATAVAFVARVVIVAVTRRRWPSVAVVADRWWAWAPLVVMCLFAIWLLPVAGVVLTLGLVVALTRSGASGSPFRPRR